MTEQMNEVDVVPAKAGIQQNIFAIFLSVLALLVAIGAFAFTYLQLTKENTAFSQQVATLQQQTSDSATQLQSLSQSVQQLQQIQQANLRDNQDMTALYNQLIALNDQIDQLPLSPTPLQQQPEQAPVPVENEADMSWWQKGLNKSLAVLRQIVIVRYNETKTIPLVLPEERHFIYLNLHTEMQNMIWAVLHHNQTVFQTSLAHVTNWVQQYFMQQSPATINMIQALNTLKIINLQPQDQQQAGT